MTIKLPFNAKMAVLADTIVGTCPKCHKTFQMDHEKAPEDEKCPHCGFTYEEPIDHPQGV